MPNYKDDSEKIIDKNEYRLKIKTPILFNSFEIERAKSALQSALDIRKFEIDLYWKRATYFWTFISVIYGGYFYILSKIVELTQKQNELSKLGVSDLPEIDSLYILLMAISMLGTFFALAWYWVNLGSKFWQENWEAQVDALENMVHGPLYKTVIFKEKQSFLSSKPFSVSKINTSLSLVIFIVSLLCLLFTAQLIYYKTAVVNSGIYTGIVVVLLCCFIVLFYPGNLENSVWKSYKRFKMENEDSKQYFVRKE